MPLPVRGLITMAYAFYDPSEYDADTTMPIVPNAIERPNLERDTGSDWLLSPLDVDRAHTDKQLAMHLVNGAQMVQAKRTDLASSVGYRVNDSLARMRAICLQALGRYSASQCALLPCGIHWPGKGGELWSGQLVQGVRPYAYVEEQRKGNVTYTGIESAKAWWTLRGGVVLPDCLTLSELPAYLTRQLARLVECQQSPTKVVYPPKPTVPMQECEVDGLQLLVQASPTLKLLVAIPGIGIDLAQTIIMHYASEPGMTVLDMLANLSSPAGNHPRGWGKARQTNLANALWVKPRQPLTIDNGE